METIGLVLEEILLRYHLPCLSLAFFSGFGRLTSTFDSLFGLPAALHLSTQLGLQPLAALHHQGLVLRPLMSACTFSLGKTLGYPF